MAAAPTRPSMTPPAAAVGTVPALPEDEEPEEPLDSVEVAVPVVWPDESVRAEVWVLPAAELTREVMVLPSEVKVVMAPAAPDERLETNVEPSEVMVVRAPPAAPVADETAPLASEVMLESRELASERMLETAPVAVLPAPVISEMTLGRTPVVVS